MKKLFFTIIPKDQESYAFRWISSIGSSRLRAGWTVLIAAHSDCSLQWVPKDMILLKTSILHPSCIYNWVCSEDYSLLKYSPCTETTIESPAKILIYTVGGRTKEFLGCTRMFLHSFRAHHPGSWYDLAVITDLDCRDLCEEYDTHFIRVPAFQSSYEASASKLSLYSIFDTSQYEKILYFDSDILIHGCLKDVLEGVEGDGVFHVVQEGYLNQSNYRGTTPAPFEGIDVPKTAPGYSAGFFGFANGPASKELLESMHRRTRPGEGCLEQPWVNRILWETKAASTTLFQPLLSAKPEILPNIINHFCGSIGDGTTKTQRMLQFLSSQKTV